MDTSRTSNSLKNMAFGVGSQMLSILMGFFTRWMFIALLGKEYLGVSGLFTNVLSLLSLANLGFDTAIIYSLYKPLAEGDMVAVKGYMRVYRRVYRAVGATVFVLGCILMPFLPHLIKGTVTIPESIYVIYFLFLTQSASSYLFSYKQSLLTASQQNRINSLYHSIFMVLRNLGEMVVLLFFHAYIPTLICIIAFQLAENAWIARVTNKKFPFLTDSSAGEISLEQKQALKENVKSLFLYKISGTIISSTDNILISKFQGLASVGLCTLAVGTLCFAIARSITLKNPILAFAIEMGICALLPNIFFFILFKRRAEFQIILGYMKRISRKIARRS